MVLTVVGVVVTLAGGFYAAREARRRDLVGIWLLWLAGLAGGLMLGLAVGLTERL